MGGQGQVSAPDRSSCLRQTLRETPLRHLNARVYLGDSRRELRRVRFQAASAEACHFWAAVLFTPFIAVAAVGGRWSIAGWFLVAQLLVNVYPILHLRYIRGRLDRAIDRPGKARSAHQEIVGEFYGA